jgi:hypothetical protein
VAGDDWDPDDVLVTIGHPFGDLEVPFTQWMAKGPGPRHGIRPQSARSRSTGDALPLTVIPLAYRNDRVSRALIAAGRIEPPWPGTDHVELSGPRHFEELVPDSHAAAAKVRRLAAEARWDEFDAFVELASTTGIADIGPVLCEVLESDANPPRPGNIVQALGRLRYGDAAETLERLLGRFVFADNDLTNARLCLRTLRTIGKAERLPIIAWGDWPDPIPQWAVAEFPAWRQ